MDNVRGLISVVVTSIFCLSKLNRKKICLLNNVYRLLLHCLFFFNNI